MTDHDPQATPFDRLGGRPFFDELAARFYERVAVDPLLRPMYPRDLGPAQERMAGFLAQYWGGGTSHYSDARGHPRLRMRHAPYVIDPAARSAWLTAMLAALEACGPIPEDLDAAMREYFVSASDFMINTP